MTPRTPSNGLRLTSAFGAAGTVLLLLMALGNALGWEDRAPVEGWMTPRFVMLAQGLTESGLLEILGADGLAPGRTLARIADDRGIARADLVAAVEAAALARAGTQAGTGAGG